jgi:hypothetical protein
LYGCSSQSWSEWDAAFLDSMVTTPAALTPNLTWLVGVAWKKKLFRLPSCWTESELYQCSCRTVLGPPVSHVHWHRQLTRATIRGCLGGQLHTKEPSAAAANRSGELTCCSRQHAGQQKCSGELVWQLKSVLVGLGYSCHSSSNHAKPGLACRNCMKVETDSPPIMLD